MKIKVCRPPFSLWWRGNGRRGDKERGKRTCVRKVNLFGSVGYLIKESLCSFNLFQWSCYCVCWEMVEGPGPEHQRWESPRPAKVAIKEQRGGGEGRTNQSCSGCSGFSCVVRWRGMQQYQNTIMPQEQVRSTIFIRTVFVFFKTTIKNWEKVQPMVEL